MCLEFIDDVGSIHSESTASFTEEFGDDEKNLPELTRLTDTTACLNEPESSLSTGPPGTVKKRPPKEKGMNDQDVLIKLQEICVNSDPLLIYSGMVKIGQG